jgi:hypothetical protein
MVVACIFDDEQSERHIESDGCLKDAWIPTRLREDDKALMNFE